MQMKFEDSVVVNAPADKVFAYVSDLTKMSEWGKFTTGVRKTSEGPIGVGTTYESDGKQFGSHTDKVNVVEYVEGKSFATESNGSAGHTRVTMTLEPQGNATKVTRIHEFLKASVATMIFSPVVKRAAPKGVLNDLQAIKAKIESSA